VLNFNVYNNSQLSHALSTANWGDSINVYAGTYDPFAVTRQGLTITGHGASVNSSGHWSGIDIAADNTVVQGFNVYGEAGSVSYSYAMSQKYNTSNPTTNGDGIDISSFIKYVTVANNTVHDEPGAGIAASHDDYVTITGNTVYNNAKWSPYADSGIDVGTSWNSDGNTGTKMVISNNTAYNNEEIVPNHWAGKVTDGNGIIVDSCNYVGYKGHTLITSNNVHHNGGAGIHVYQSDHNIIQFNTSAYNNTNVPSYGQIDISNSNDVHTYHNKTLGPRRG
jgi:parallel beta-helix repeat protein